MNDKASLLGQLRNRSRPGAGRQRLALVGSGRRFRGRDRGWSLARSGGARRHPGSCGGGEGRKQRSLGPASGGFRRCSTHSGYVVAQLRAAVSGKSIYKVTDILVAEGQHVKKDEVIARLDDSNAHAALNQASAQVRASEATLAAATRALADITPIYQRNQALVKSGWVSQDALDTSAGTYDALDETGLEVARQQLGVAKATLEVAQRFEEDTIVRAPFDGVVTLKSAQPGQIVSPQFQGGGGIATIVDMNSLEVEVDVSESFISRVHGHQPVGIKLNAYPDWLIPGEVITVIPTADQSKATVKVRVAFQGEGRPGRARDGRAGVVPQRCAHDPREARAATPGTLVPAESRPGQRRHRRGVCHQGRHRRTQRAVRLGAKSEDGQVVLSGLAAGDIKLAIGDLTQLSDGKKIHVE